MPKILYLITEDWFFASHFLPMARAAREAGFEIAVATRIGTYADRIGAEGIRVIPLEQERGSSAPSEIVGYIAHARSIIRDEDPDIVHCIALRSAVLGGIAARAAKVPHLVLAPTGLGHLWIERGFGPFLARGVVRHVIGSMLRRPQTRYLFENHEDPKEFGLDPNGPEVTIIGGAGVDPRQFPMVPEPASPPVKLAVVARMIVPKGIAEAVDATRRARALGAPVELHLFGAPDPSNRRSIPQATLRAWAAEPGMHWHGPSTDVARVWRDHHVALFLSYREGLPRTLIEAAASGRPIVTNDVPGCREVVRDGREGFLVPLGDTEAAARAIVKLAMDPALRARLGAAANARFCDRFTEKAVKKVVSGLYRSVLADRG
jgi:glycosyltransferase involved in cell wall biosynthesis